MPESTPAKHQYDCPCCGVPYTATIARPHTPIEQNERGVVLRFEEAIAPGFNVCEDCHQPCCPKCQYVGGERVICTRCTTYPECAHEGGTFGEGRA
ncbi:MAG: hypothetical protein Q7R80_02925 [bacterium]|nr:hypothetical protein [bacterium]